MTESNAGQFVIRVRGRRGGVDQGPRLHAGHGGGAAGSRSIGVRYTERVRTTGHLGEFRTVERAAWARSHLIIGTGMVGAIVPSTAAGVKTVLRRIREQEAGALDAIDAEVAELRSRLATLNVERRAALRQAFRRGNVVRLAEVIALADEDGRAVAELTTNKRGASRRAPAPGNGSTSDDPDNKTRARAGDAQERD